MQLTEEKYEVVEWCKINFFSFTSAEIVRLKRFVELGEE